MVKLWYYSGTSLLRPPEMYISMRLCRGVAEKCVCVSIRSGVNCDSCLFLPIFNHREICCKLADTSLFHLGSHAATIFFTTWIKTFFAAHCTKWCRLWITAASPIRIHTFFISTVSILIASCITPLRRCMYGYGVDGFFHACEDFFENVHSFFLCLRLFFLFFWSGD